MGFARAAMGLFLLPGGHGQNRAARGAPREIARLVSLRFPLFSECGSVDKNDLLRFPPFSSVFLRFPLLVLHRLRGVFLANARWVGGPDHLPLASSLG